MHIYCIHIAYTHFCTLYLNKQSSFAEKYKAIFAFPGKLNYVHIMWTSLHTHIFMYIYIYIVQPSLYIDRTRKSLHILLTSSDTCRRAIFALYVRHEDIFGHTYCTDIFALLCDMQTSLHIVISIRSDLSSLYLDCMRKSLHVILTSSHACCRAIFSLYIRHGDISAHIYCTDIFAL